MAAEGEYERRISAAYPIHPELFDRLYEDWSTLDTFQRTRGVLRLMAAVVHELWERNDAGLLILPAALPIDAPAVSAQLTRYLEEGWTPVIEADVAIPMAPPPASVPPARVARDDGRWNKAIAGVYLRPARSATEALQALYRRVADDEDGELLVVGDEADRSA